MKSLWQKFAAYFDRRMAEATNRVKANPLLAAAIILAAFLLPAIDGTKIGTVWRWGMIAIAFIWNPLVAAALIIYFYRCGPPKTTTIRTD